MARRQPTKNVFGCRVETVRLPATRVVAIGPDDPAWTTGAPEESVAGAFVRLRPPPSADEALIERMRAACSTALATKLERPNAPKPVCEPGADGYPKAEEFVRYRNARVVVEQIARESNSADRAALVDLVSKIADEVKL